MAILKGPPEGKDPIMVNTQGTFIYCPYLNKLKFDYLLFAHK